MLTKQLTIFMEDREGRLCEVLEILKENDINVLSASIADNGSDFGLFRMTVSDTEKAYEALKAKGMMVKITEIIAVTVPHRTGSLETILKAISEADINIQYMYGMASEDHQAAIAIKTDNQEKALEVLKKVEHVTANTN